MSKSRKDAIQELKERIDYEIQRKSWKEALVYERELIDTYHTTYCLLTILRRITFDGDEINAMKNSMNKSSLFLVGFVLYAGPGGVSKDWETAYACLGRAADMGHMYALNTQGVMLRFGEGVKQDAERGLRCYMRAAEAGCAVAARNAGECSTDKRTSARYYAMGVCLGDSVCKNNLSYLLRDHPMEAAPFSNWKPDPVIHMTVPNRIRNAMQTSLLYLRTRQKIPRYACNLVMFYICTRNGWNL